MRDIIWCDLTYPLVETGPGEGHTMRQWEQYRASLFDLTERHPRILVLLASFFVVGLVFGTMGVRALSAADRLDVVRYLAMAVPGMAELEGEARGMLLSHTITAKIKLVAVLWLMGISVVGSVGVMLYAFYRGFLSGFLFGFLAAELGGSGMALGLLAHLPQSLIEIPVLMLAAAASVAFSLQVIRAWRTGRRLRHFYPQLAAFTGTLAIAGLILVGVSLFEAFVSPALLRSAGGLFIGH